MYYCTPKIDVILDKHLQKHLSKEHRKHGVIDQWKYRKISSKIKWTDREYHVQDNADVSHKNVKIYCDTNHLPELPCCGPHTKPHGARGLSNHYHLSFDTKLGHGIFEIRRIPCDCVGCTSMLDKPWIYGIPSKKQARYQRATICNYWPVMGSYNNWNIIELTPKSTSFDEFDEIYKDIIDGISENTDSLVQSVMYGAINTYDTT